jgi:hypothetical protein
MWIIWKNYIFPKQVNRRSLIDIVRKQIYLSKPCLCKPLCNLKCVRKHDRPIISAVICICSFINYLYITRLWTGSRSIWLEYLNSFISPSFEDFVFLVVSLTVNEKTDHLSIKLHNRVAQQALRLRCVRSICYGAFKKKSHC